MSYNKETLIDIIKNYNYRKNKWQIFTKAELDKNLEKNFTNANFIYEFLNADILTDNLLKNCSKIEILKPNFSADINTIFFMLIYKKYFNSINKNDDERKYDVKDKEKLFDYVDTIYKNVSDLSEDEQLITAMVLSNEEAEKKEDKQVTEALALSNEEAKKAEEERLRKEQAKKEEAKKAEEETDFSDQVMMNDLEELLKKKGLESNSTIEELINKLPMDVKTLSLFTELYNF